MTAYLTILRPVNGIMAAIAVYIGGFIAGSPFFPPEEILLGMLAVFLISAGGMVINDAADAAADAINRPKRAIPAGKISRNGAIIYAAFLFFLGNFAAYMITWQAFYIALVATVLLIGYSVKFKGVAMMGHIIISLLVAITFVYGGAIAGDYSAVIPLAILAFVSNIGREIYKTIDDALGDKSVRTRTVAIIIGVHRARALGNIFILAAVALSIIPYIMGIMNEVYLFLAGIADVVFIVATISPLRMSSKLTKIAMSVALAAFLVGAYSVRIGF